VERQFAQRDATILSAPLLASVALIAYVTMIGGDYMHARMLLASLFLLVLPVLLVPATLFNFGVVSMIALWAVLALSPLRVPFDGGGTSEGIDTRNIRLEDEEWTKRANPTTVADWLNGFAGYRPL
jgi:arabinofuranosyltransferase